MTELSQPLQEMLDKSAIHETLIRYVNANDADDWPAMAACFTENGRMGSSIGRAALTELFSGMRSRGTLMGVDVIDRGMHMVTNVEIKVEGERARSYCAALIYLTAHRGSDVVLLVRGVTYTDELAKEDGRWRIASRTHSLKWMYEVKPTIPETPVSPEPGAAGVR